LLHEQAGARRRVAEGQRPPNGQGPRRIVAEPVGSTLRIEPGAAVSDSADRRNPCPDVTAGHAVIEGTWPWPADKPCGTGRETAWRWVSPSPTRGHGRSRPYRRRPGRAPARLRPHRPSRVEHPWSRAGAARTPRRRG